MDVVVKGRRLAVAVGPHATGLVVSHALPCVLLHPFPFDGRYFANIAELLEGHALTVVPNFRGVGGSELGGSFSIDDLADDLAGVLDHLQIEQAVVLGLSMGGYVALAFAAKHSHRLRGLVLADTRAGADGTEARAGRQTSLDMIRARGVEAFVDAQLPRLLSPQASPGVWQQARALATKDPAALQAALEALRDRPDRRDELPAITCPTLVIVGAEDALTPPAEAAAMTTSIPQARLVELPGVGHLSSLEAPGPFAEAIIGFLGRVSG